MPEARTDTVEMEKWYIKAEQRGWMRQYEVERLCTQKGANARECIRLLLPDKETDRRYRYDFNEVINWINTHKL